MKFHQQKSDGRGKYSFLKHGNNYCKLIKTVGIKAKP